MRTSKNLSINKAFSPALLLILVALVVLIAGAAYFFGRKSVNSPNKKASLPNLTSNETATWQTYVDPILNFSIKYPKGWETYLVDVNVAARVYRHKDADEGNMFKTSGGAVRVFQKVGPMEVVPPIRLDTTKIVPPYDFAFYEKEFKNSKVVNHEITKTKIEGIDALRDRETKENEFIRNLVLFQKDNYLFSIATTNSDNEVTLNQMISTLKFTN